VRQVLARWNLEPDRVTRIGGLRNCHWRVRAGPQSYILRRYRNDRDLPAINYELSVLDQLRGKGWPVPSPVGDLRWWDGVPFMLWDMLPGRKRPASRQDGHQGSSRGAWLALLHRDLRHVTVAGQRSGWRRCDEFLVQEADAIERLTRTRLAFRPDLVMGILESTRAVASELARLPVTALPMTVVHGDFIEQNLLFQANRLSGIVDFDDVHYDLRAADVACARRDQGDAVVEGYCAVEPLSLAELTLVGPLWCAYTLLFVWQLLQAPALSERVLSALEWCVVQLRITRPYGRVPAET
jgi:homoserine kinase type II